MRSCVVPLLLLGACSFAWDELDPRSTAGAGGDASSVTTSTTSSTASSGGDGGRGGSGGDVGMGGDGGAPPTVTTTLGERPSCDLQEVTEDANLQEGNPDLNYGDSGTIRADINGALEVRALLRFSLAKLPPGAQITAAEIHLVTGSEMNAASNEAVSFYALLEDWTEGTQSAMFGVANWNQRRLGEAWASPGAGDRSRSPQPFASVTMDAISTAYTVVVPASLAQSWLDTPAQNFGMVLEIESSDGVVLLSSESTATMSRPVMAVTYLPP